YDVHAGKKPSDNNQNGVGIPGNSKDVTAGGQNNNDDNSTQDNSNTALGNACPAFFFPAISTVATGGTFAADGTVSISDAVTLSGAGKTATGSMTVEAFGPQTGTPYVCDNTNKVGSTTVSLSGADVNHAYNVTLSPNTIAKAGNYVFT